MLASQLKFLLLFFFFFFLASIQPAYAHVGGGPPFVKVNGEYAQTNPYYQGATTLNIPQDMSPESYLVNRKIIFSIDNNALTKQSSLLPNLANQLQFRWSFGSGKTFEKIDKTFQSGSQITHIFTSPKSYLVIVEAKDSLSTNYTLIDTIQVNVVPSFFYHPPGVALFIGTNTMKANDPIILVSQPTLNNAASSIQYLWDFDDGRIYTGKSIKRVGSLSDVSGIGVVFHRVIDQFGLITDIGFTIESHDGKLQAFPFSTMTSIPVSFGSYDKAERLSKTDNTSSHIINPFMVLIFIIFAFLIGFVIKKWRRKS